MLMWSAGFSQTRVPVFVSGKDGHRSYRIPSIISLQNGDLLAIAEGRVAGSADFGDINLVMKRSADKGKTWSELITLVDNDSLQAGNPSPVVDLLDSRYPQGRIFLFYNTGNNHEGEVRKGKGVREVWYITSIDNGVTWSQPVNITTQVHRPNQPAFDSRYTFTEDWRSYANTPGHALQITSGKYRGRILVPANHSAGDPLPQSHDYAAHAFFTDDHGKTFELGETLDVPGSNESTAAELSDGSVMMNVRNQAGDVRARIVAISSSGGLKWDTVYFDRNLPDPVCEGALLTIGKKKGKVGDVNIQTDHLPVEGVDTITLYLNPQNQKEYYDYILELKPNRIIFNPGTENVDLIKQAKENGIEPVVGCTLVMLTTGMY